MTGGDNQGVVLQEAGVPRGGARVRRVQAPPVLQADHRGREGQVLGAAVAGPHPHQQLPGDHPGSVLNPVNPQPSITMNVMPVERQSRTM